MRRPMVAVLAVAALMAWRPAAAQSDYPDRAVHIIVPFAAGGPADIYARYVGQFLEDALNQPFVIEDRPGAGSLIGTNAVAKSAPDGYTLVMVSNTHTTNESLIPDKPFQLMRDFTPVSAINYSDLVFVVHPSVPADTVEELVALAKSKPHVLNYASSGPGTPYHLAAELFKAMTGTDIVHVPYRGSSDARTGVIGGQVQMMFDAVTTMAPNAQAGQVRALATTGRTRTHVLPDVPTMAEAGVSGYEAVIWIGLMAPAGTPAAIVDKLNAEVEKVLARPDIREAWARQGATPLPMSVAEFDAFLRADIEKWAKVVKLSGAKPE